MDVTLNFARRLPAGLAVAGLLLLAPGLVTANDLCGTTILADLKLDEDPSWYWRRTHRGRGRH